MTADDFGLHEAVNQAVESGYRDGVLRAASLMVTAPAAADAVERARRLPGLAVGLHLVLADGRAALPSAQIPDLVDPHGRFGNRMVGDGMRFFFLPRVRRQLAAEIRAQFEAFAATGLALDHVNAHKHFHLHPTVLGLLLSIGRDYGLRAVRLPAEPGMGPWLRPWLALMRRRLRRSGVRYNDHVFGLRHTGGMDESVLLTLLQQMPAGLSEMYLHPATHGQLSPSMADYRHADELAALLSPRVHQAIAERCHLCRGFSDPAAA
ncbi:hopanoid biosynthesis-associated protein HpnK [Dyella solisilvae]|uniref:hopanoid biosynthesis-associated protein HpnK n=1 Tax=Dyella solisilvae TaxID=1920168 RepID=UPI001F3FCB61|nr:hopanoid biosynthesis-associated protein HpnK [Dyella solisilvae]